jgi:hypothetical protein
MSSAIPQGGRQEEDIGEMAEDSRSGGINLTLFGMIGIRMVLNTDNYQDL